MRTARANPAANRNDVAAIHVMKSQLRLTEDDYRALLRGLTGRGSCTEMSVQQLQAVRHHLDGLVRVAGVGRPGGEKPRRPLSAAAFEEAKRAASPKERKIWAMWNQLGREGRLDNPSSQALDAWVRRQVGVDSLRFCTGAQLDTLIESLKGWHERTGGVDA